MPEDQDRRTMDINSFLYGFGSGICLGLTVFAFRRYLIRVPIETAKATDETGVMKFLNNNSEYKLVLVVRNDLGMGKGKIAAQCSHAAVGAYSKAVKKDPNGVRLWEYTGQAKVALKIDSETELKEIAANAKKLGIITSLIRDAGRTQIAANTTTVLGVGPAPKDVIDQVTGHLKLL